MLASKNVLLLFLPLLLSSGAHMTNEGWYQKYPAYPPYCSVPLEMENRKIPPLMKRADEGETRLQHVTAVIRHGARTPYSNDVKCWEGFWESPETGVWDCELTSFLSPPSPREIDEEEGGKSTGGGSDAMFLFEKKYDALKKPLKNYLNGTCQVGQLLLQGYDQELRNGELLRDAYVYDSNNYDHEIHMRLLDVSDKENPIYLEPVLRYRADDDQRTTLSGQILLRGLFGSEFVAHLEEHGEHPIIALHTADRRRDVLAPDSNLCPRLDVISDTARSSDEFKEFMKSQQPLRDFMKEELGSETVSLDCLMTTICTDRTLPLAINDYEPVRVRRHLDENKNGNEDKSGYRMSRFQRIADYNIRQYTMVAKHNDSEYSKLGMGPLWAEILEIIMPIVDPDDRAPPQNKLFLTAGHDTSIIPLMASLDPDAWDDVEWPPYGSMMIIEIHEFIDGKDNTPIYQRDFGFRLIYNGEVMTSRISGCPPEHDICDIQVLLDRVQPFATQDRSGCAVETKGDAVDTEEKESAIALASELIHSVGGSLLVLFVILITALLGALMGAYYIIKQSRQVSKFTPLNTEYRDHPESTDIDNEEDEFFDVPPTELA